MNTVSKREKKPKDFEKAFRESEERYRKLFEEDLTGDFITTPEGKIVDCNPAFVKIFGFSSKMEALDSGILSTYPDPKDWRGFLALIKKRIKIERHEDVRKKRDGTLIKVMENAVGSFNAHGKLFEIKSYLYDDTERKKTEDALRKAEERYRTLIELIPDAIWVSDTDTIWFANPAAAILVGAASHDDLVGLSLQDLFHPDDRARVIERTDIVIRKGIPQPLERRKVQRLDGQIVDVETAVAPCIFDGRLGVLRVGRDITSRIKAEEDLLKKDREISIHSQKVEKLNIALKVLLDQRDEESKQKDKNIRATLDKLAIPYLQSLKTTPLTEEQKTYIDLLEANLNNIASSFARQLSTWHEKLTPTEIRIAELITVGKRTKEIADLLKVSSCTISFHRANMRKKLDLQSKSINLISHLRLLNQQI